MKEPWETSNATVIHMHQARTEQRKGRSWRKCECDIRTSTASVHCSRVLFHLWYSSSTGYWNLAIPGSSLLSSVDVCFRCDMSG